MKSRHTFIINVFIEKEVIIKDKKIKIKMKYLFPISYGNYSNMWVNACNYFLNFNTFGTWEKTHKSIIRDNEGRQKNGWQKNKNVEDRGIYDKH